MRRFQPAQSCFPNGAGSRTSRSAMAAGPYAGSYQRKRSPPRAGARGCSITCRSTHACNPCPRRAQRSRRAGDTQPALRPPRPAMSPSRAPLPSKSCDPQGSSRGTFCQKPPRKDRAPRTALRRPLACVRPAPTTQRHKNYRSRGRAAHEWSWRCSATRSSVQRWRPSRPACGFSSNLQRKRGPNPPPALPPASPPRQSSVSEHSTEPRCVKPTRLPWSPPRLALGGVGSGRSWLGVRRWPGYKPQSRPWLILSDLWAAEVPFLFW
mmetsp:Transcript_88297/g.248653  ORF Transcript_88297/g.248653 Transcript_88297/m.248653 type:complete len:266 (+) Transcript_88297:266-1063(+)